MSSPRDNRVVPWDPSWICPTLNDYRRFVDMQPRVRRTRRLLQVVLSGPLLLTTWWTGWPIPMCFGFIAISGLCVEWRERRTGASPGLGLAGVVSWLGVTDVFYPDVVIVLSFLATFFGITVVVFTFQSADIQTREQADTDLLTGLPSRKALDAALRHLFDRPAASACVLMCDVDHFKAINDTFGHDRGDQVLRGVADVLRTALRPHEQVFRYGGKEFIVLIEGLTGIQASAVATRICTAVAGATIHESHVTISVGVALRDGADSSDGLIFRADAAMYAAKRAGRNRAVVWGAHLQHGSGSLT